MKTNLKVQHYLSFNNISCTTAEIYSEKEFFPVRYPGENHFVFNKSAKKPLQVFSEADRLFYREIKWLRQ